MNHHHFYPIFCRFASICFVTGFAALSASPALAETVAYPGSPLQIIDGEADSLGPAYDQQAGRTNSLTGNKVTLDGDTVNYVYGAVTVDPSATDDVTGNTVIINDGTVECDVFGGASLGGAANNNIVYINDGFVEGNVVGGNGVAGGATGNKIIMSGGEVQGAVSGGGSDADGNATGNSVTISGGTVGGDVNGGWSVRGDSTGNTVTISGSPDLSASGIYGGYGNSGGGDVWSGNTLNLHTNNLTVRALCNFEYLNFYVPKGMGNNGVLMTVTGDAIIEESTVNVGVEGSSSPLKPGDRVILIDAETLTGQPVNDTANGRGMHGVTLKYLFDVGVEGNQLIASLRAIEVNEQIKALAEGYLSGLILLRQGGDLVAGQGMGQAVASAARAEHSHLYGYGIFATISGGWSRYDTGSHVDVSSVNLLAGVSKAVELEPGRLTLGAFFEYGNGSYDSYNSFSNAASVHGKGDMHYIGGGVLGRMDFAGTSRGGFYAQGDVRAGGVHTDFNSSDLRDAEGRRASYDSSSTYYSAHAGAGYIWNLAEDASLDIYGMYLWTREEGDSVRLSTGEKVSFKDADSHRLRFGGRFAYAVHERVRPYIGAAYEHEFDGRARASTNGYALDTPDLKGGTGIGEIGILFPPSESLPLSVNLGVQGYAGKREGVAGVLQVKLEF